MIFGDSMYIIPPERAALRRCGLDSVAAVLDRTDGHVAAWSRSTDTLLTCGVAGRPGYYLKRYRYPTWRRRLRGLFRGTFLRRHRGREEFRLLENMRALGIPAVRPLAYGSRRVGRFLSACFLITEETPGAENLTTLALQVAAGRRTLAPRLRRAMAVELAASVAHMHNAGFSHGQLYWRNILFRLTPTGDPEFFFLDARPRRSRRWFARRNERYLLELGHLAASALPFTTRTERLRFVQAYIRARHIQVDPRKVIAFLSRLARRHARHERQRIRMSRRFEAWNRRLALDTRVAAPTDPT